MIFSQESLRA